MAETKNPAGAPQIKPASPFKSIFPALAIVAMVVIAHVVFYNFFGDARNFEGGPEAKKAYEAAKQQWVNEGKDPASEPDDYHNALHPVKKGTRRLMGLVFKGGFVVPIGITLLLTLITFTIERGITVASASGRGNKDVFVRKIRMLLAQGNIDGAMAECDKQKGSVGNVVKAGLRKYKEMAENSGMDKDHKKLAIQTEIEEATMLELPMLQRNLSIISTIAALGTLVGLIGTVIGMIKSFSALGTQGAPNAAELSVGISEALINTALGITTSALSVAIYNYFTTQIDGMTYAMEEAGYSIVQTYDVRES